MESDKINTERVTEIAELMKTYDEKTLTQAQKYS